MIELDEIDQELLRALARDATQNAGKLCCAVGLRTATMTVAESKTTGAMTVADMKT